MSVPPTSRTSYSKRSWAHFPLLWSLNHVDRSPDPNPCGVELSDTRNFQFYKNAIVDQEMEAKLDDRS